MKKKYEPTWSSLDSREKIQNGFMMQNLEYLFIGDYTLFPLMLLVVLMQSGIGMQKIEIRLESTKQQ